MYNLECIAYRLVQKADKEHWGKPAFSCHHRHFSNPGRMRPAEEEPCL